MRILACFATLLLLAAPSAFAADHNDAPKVQQDPTADINDIYAFVNPNDPGELILILTVIPDAPNGARFSDAVKYNFFINSGSVAKNISCEFIDEGEEILCGGPNKLFVRGQVGGEVMGDGMRVFSGLRDDPFFFDGPAFNQTRATLVPAFTDPGFNSFGTFNTLAIVLGVQTSRLVGEGESPVLTFWANSERLFGDGISGAITGAWYDPANPRHGFFVHVTRLPDGSERFVASWDVYTPPVDGGQAGQQLYLVGDGPFDGDTATLTVFSTSGGSFPPTFGDAVQLQEWGTLTFVFSDCNTAQLSYASILPEYGSGELPLTRLTNIAGLDCQFLDRGQIDRMGRPGVNTALIDLLANTGLKDAYNRASDPDTWAPLFQTEMQNNIAALDTLDGVVGNALLPPETLAAVLVDDRLVIDVSVPDCDAYLAVELGVAGQCGGRTLERDVIDDTLGALVGPGVSDFVDFDSVVLAQFPFMGPPQ